MSLSHQKKALISEPLPCPECGEIKMVHTVETCRLSDGFTIKMLRYYKCRSCNSHFFDDNAMKQIQKARRLQTTASTVK